MWDTAQTNQLHLSHDLPCPRCGHAVHTYLACSDTCECAPTVMAPTGSSWRSMAAPMSSTAVTVWTRSFGPVTTWSPILPTC